MRIVLSGVETNNKGAELMLYAILQEIERTYPDAEVLIPYHNIPQGLDFVDTHLKLQFKPFFVLKRIAYRLKIAGILRRIGWYPYWMYDQEPVRKVDYFIDGSGFAFSDQWKPSECTIKIWRHQLSQYKKQGTKIVFLPQAFGPVECKETRELISVLDTYADVIMPRERVSMAYLESCKVSQSKIKLFTDFTSLVQGIVPEQYHYLKGAICIIPNKRMIDKGTISLDKYLNILTRIIQKAQSIGKDVYILNHEGKGDEELAYMCQAKLDEEIEVVTGLNGLEVKGLISTSYVCITSRFHGVASALNSCVPCLATSWSHKYEELFRDYGLANCVLDISEPDKCVDKVVEFMGETRNAEIRQLLTEKLPVIQQQTRKMWKEVW